MTAPSEIDAALKRIESGWRVGFDGRWWVFLATRAKDEGCFLNFKADASAARAEYLRLSAREE
jgi:hypothetical protein